jgi:hypothetical protein
MGAAGLWWNAKAHSTLRLDGAMARLLSREVGRNRRVECALAFHRAQYDVMNT